MPRIDVSSWKEGMGASYLGVFFVVVVALGGLGGNWLDQRFHTTPWFAVTGVALGMAAGIREMLKTLNEISTPPSSTAVDKPASRSGERVDGGES